MVTKAPFALVLEYLIWNKLCYPGEDHCELLNVSC